MRRAGKRRSIRCAWGGPASASAVVLPKAGNGSQPTLLRFCRHSCRWCTAWAATSVSRPSIWTLAQRCASPPALLIALLLLLVHDAAGPTQCAAKHCRCHLLHVRAVQGAHLHPRHHLPGDRPLVPPPGQELHAPRQGGGCGKWAAAVQGQAGGCSNCCSSGRTSCSNAGAAQGHVAVLPWQWVLAVQQRERCWCMHLNLQACALLLFAGTDEDRWTRAVYRLHATIFQARRRQRRQRRRGDRHAGRQAGKSAMCWQILWV